MATGGYDAVAGERAHLLGRHAAVEGGRMRGVAREIQFGVGYA